MTDIDYDKIETIVNKAAGNVSTKLITKTVAGVLQTYGIHDPEEMQKLMVYGKACMKDKADMRRGFWGGLGGHLAAIVVSVGAAIAAMKGFGN
jgi:hypothetical protein